MKLLVVGSGAREHALVWKLARDDPAATILAAPGNPGIAVHARCVPIKASELSVLAALARSEQVDVTIVGPEAPLAAGIVDVFRREKLPIFGPTQRAAQIESSKRFAKELMLAAGVPTAQASWHRDVAAAKRAARGLGAPVVIKASGLAAGKGVAVCMTLNEADSAIESMLEGGIHGDAGSEILVEEFMEGEELSVFALTDGERFVTMIPAQDHKRLGEGDTGPNTGGMGAYAPVSLSSRSLLNNVERSIFEPTLSALRNADASFTGLLYAGLMLTADGPKVVEFNCRFGDPETEVILPLLLSRIDEPITAIAQGDRLTASAFDWVDACAVTTVVASPGYPEAPRTGASITLPSPIEDVHLFHAGTALANGNLVTAGGRVFAVTVVDPDFETATQRSASAAASIDFDGRQYRRDIGWRELTRRARVT